VRVNLVRLATLQFRPCRVATLMSKCKSCNATIAWVKTRAGRSMPCDLGFRAWPDGVVVTIDGETLCGGGVGFRPHWATCPQAAAWKRKAQRELFGRE
jgi:hypothetical protein